MTKQKTKVDMIESVIATSLDTKNTLYIIEFNFWISLSTVTKKAIFITRMIEQNAMQNPV